MAQTKKKKRTNAVRKPRTPLPDTRRVPSRSVVAMPPMPPGHSAFIKMAKGHLLPFSQEALGCKVPDSNSAKTYTYRSLTRTVMYSDGSNRYWGFTFSPTSKEEVSNWTTPSTATGAWSGESKIDSAAQTVLAASSGGQRLVSWGVRLFCTAPYDKCDGSVVLATTRGNAGTPTNAQVLNPSGWMSYELIALRDLDHFWTSQRADDTLSTSFVVPTVGNTDTSTGGWTTLVVLYVPSSFPSVTTLTAGPAFGIEIVKNWEIVPLVNSITEGIATPSAVHDPRIHSVVNRVHQTVGDIHPSETRERTFLQALGDGVKGLAQDAVGWALPHLGQALFGRKAIADGLPTKAQRQMIMDVE